MTLLGGYFWFYSTCFVVLILGVTIFYLNKRYQRLKNVHQEYAEERYKIFFESSPDTILVMDPITSKILDGNPAALEMFQIPSKEVLLTLTPSLLSPELQPNGNSSDEFAAAKIQTIIDEGSHFYEWLHQRRDGTAFPTTIFASRFTINGRILLQGTIRDITEEKKIRDQLNHRNKMDAVGQLAGGIAHDFNNMLAGIMGAAQLLQNPARGVDKKGFSYINMIMQSSERAADLTAKLLAFGRKGRRLTTLFDIHQLIEDTVVILEHTIDKRVQIILQKRATNYQITGDQSELQSAIMSLCINAAQAMPSGGVIHVESDDTVLDTIFCENAPFNIQPGSYIKIKIEDTGCGIPLCEQPKIFEPFYTTKQVGEGTGLGLSAVYGTIEEHHGAIRVYSEPENGTSIFLLLPVSIDEEIPKKKPAIDKPPQKTGLILLVDDEEIIRLTGKYMLEALGYQVLIAEDGESGVDQFNLKHKEIDCIVMDMVMPRMNGCDAFLKMREIDQHCKAIIASGFPRNQHIEALFELGLAGFIRKPYQNSELSALLSTVLR